MARTVHPGIDGNLVVDPDSENALARSIESYKDIDQPPSTEKIVERAREFRKFLAEADAE